MQNKYKWTIKTLLLLSIWVLFILPAPSMQKSYFNKQENADNNIHIKAALFIHMKTWNKHQGRRQGAMAPTMST